MTGDERRHANRLVACVELGEADEPLSFERIVELFAKAAPHDLEEGLRVEAPPAECAHERLEHAGARSIALDGLPNTRVLHLHGDDGAVGEGRAVHLADGRARDGIIAPRREEFVDGAPKLGLHEGTIAVGEERGACALRTRSEFS